MRRQIAVDSGPLVALFDKNDADHQRALDFFVHTRFHGLVTSAVIAEVAHLLSFHSLAMLDFLEWIHRGGLSIVELDDDFGRAIELLHKYADVPMDFADATIVAACERLGVQDVLTLDSDFLIYRLHGRRMLRNLFVT